MRLGYVFILIGLPLALSSCATIDTYTDANLSPESKTGILYYPAKPYLLVSRTGAKDKPTDVQVIYLPDLAKPRYAVMRAGMGSSKLGLTFSNGVLMSANQESDPKIVEAITALAGVPGQLAAAAKTRAEAADIRAEASDLPAVVAKLRTLARDIAGIGKERMLATMLNASQRAALAALPASLDQVADALDQPAADDASVKAALPILEGVKKALSELKTDGSDASDASKDIWKRIRNAEAQLDVILADLQPAPAAPPTLTLYELMIEDGKPALRSVPIDRINGAAH